MIANFHPSQVEISIAGRQFRVSVDEARKLRDELNVMEILGGEDHPVIAVVKVHVCNHFRLLPDVMTSERRPASWAAARQIAMALSREFTKFSFELIGEAFGGKCHGTVMHACDVVRDSCAFDPEFRRHYAEVRDGIAAELNKS